MLTRLLAGCLAPAVMLVLGHASSLAQTRREAPSWTRVCPPASQALDGMWHPSRLFVIDPCVRAVGTVVGIEHIEDGDVHIYLAVTPHYRNLLNRANYLKHSGTLVVEFTPRDGGHLPTPHLNDRVMLIGAWVIDSDESWQELHPVWYVRYTRAGNPTGYVSGPRFGGSPQNSGFKEAAATCRTQLGTPCRGYPGIQAARLGGVGRAHTD